MEMKIDCNNKNFIPPSQVKPQWTKAEKLLLPVSLIIAILFDRLVVTALFRIFSFTDSPNDLELASSVFWICYLIIFHSFFWQRVKEDYVLWFVAICTLALCIWNFIFSRGNFDFRTITLFVIPSVLMAHAQWTANSFTLKSSDGMVSAWFKGWFIKPFTGLNRLLGVSASLPSEKNRPYIKKVIQGICVSAILLIIIIPLLMGADQVFNLYFRQLFSSFSLGRLILHTIIILAVFSAFYSFLWNVGFGKNDTGIINSRSLSIDPIISSIVLGSIILVYVLFCIVQFTYLFAGAGLPTGMTYSEYAREGFAQTVVVCAINLFIFGVFLKYGTAHNLIKGMLGALLVLTGIMLVSGWVRLDLYIVTFGMTWLRLLSAWFIIYLATVILLCATKLLSKKEIPLLAICSLMLLAWYVVLGYLNPDNFINWYNNVYFLR